MGRRGVGIHLHKSPAQCAWPIVHMSNFPPSSMNATNQALPLVPCQRETSDRRLAGGSVGL